jgi:hypothetical protein
MPSTEEGLTSLLSGATLDLPEAYFSGSLSNAEEERIDRRITVFQSLGTSIVSCGIKEEEGKQYSWFTSTNKASYTIFRIPAEEMLLEKLRGNQGALVFRKGEGLYVIINTHSLFPGLKRILLSKSC